MHLTGMQVYVGICMEVGIGPIDVGVWMYQYYLLVGNNTMQIAEDVS